MVQIVVNGQAREVPPASTVEDLLREMQLRQRFVAVEINGQLVPRGRHGEQQLQERDRLEVVTLVGGG